MIYGIYYLFIYLFIIYYLLFIVYLFIYLLFIYYYWLIHTYNECHINERSEMKF